MVESSAWFQFPPDVSSLWAGQGPAPARQLPQQPQGLLAAWAPLFVLPALGMVATSDSY